MSKKELIIYRLEQGNTRTQSQVIKHLVDDAQFRELIKPFYSPDEIELKTLGLKFGALINAAINKTGGEQ